MIVLLFVKFALGGFNCVQSQGCTLQPINDYFAAQVFDELRVIHYVHLGQRLTDDLLAEDRGSGLTDRAVFALETGIDNPLVLGELEVSRDYIAAARIATLDRNRGIGHGATVPRIFVVVENIIDKRLTVKHYIDS